MQILSEVRSRNQDGNEASALFRLANDKPAGQTLNTREYGVREPADLQVGMPSIEGRFVQEMDNAHNEGIKSWGRAALDSCLGLGHYLSRLKESSLPRYIRTPLQSIGAGLGRALGGFITVANTGYSLYRAAGRDIATESYTFPQTRKELVLGVGSIAGGMVAGEVGYLATAAAASLGASALLLGVIGGATALGVGYTAYKTRETLEALYN